jgi:membrane-associated phospholipid phosphatase
MPTPPSVRESTGSALLAGAVASLTGFVTLSALAMHHYLDGADRMVRGLVHGSSQSLIGSSMETASYLGGQPGQVVVIGLASAMLWRHRRRWSLALPVVMAGVGLLQFAAKWTFDRPRPNLNPWGFPSAHSFSLVVLCGCLAYVACTSSMGRRWRRLNVAISVVIVSIVALSRMYLDAHWFSDVLGGLSMGLTYLLIVIWLMREVHGLERVAEGDVSAPRLLAAEAGVDAGDEGLA